MGAADRIVFLTGIGVMAYFMSVAFLFGGLALASSPEVVMALGLLQGASLEAHLILGAGFLVGGNVILVVGLALFARCYFEDDSDTKKTAADAVAA